MVRGLHEHSSNDTQFALIAAKGFGLKRESLLNELHVEINAHKAQESAGLAPQPIHGITVHDSEVLAPEPVRQGGLMRKDAVCLHPTS
jgi:pre-mRNA-splicing factor ATP-dependent RNA helicase DHX38/PRP16